MSTFQNRVQMFYAVSQEPASNTYTIITRTQIQGGQWSDEINLGGSAAVSAAIGVATVPATGLLQIFYVGPSGSVITRAQQTDGTFGPEENLGGEPFATSVAVANVPGRGELQIFYPSKTQDGVLTRWGPAGPGAQWSPETNLGAPSVGEITTVIGEITSTLIPATEILQIFYYDNLTVGSDWRTSHGWTPQTLPGRPGATVPFGVTVIPKTGIVQLFFQSVGVSGITTIYRENDAWIGPQTLSTEQGVDSRISAASTPNTGLAQILYISASQIVTQWRDPTSGAWSGEHLPGIEATSAGVTVFPNPSDSDSFTIFYAKETEPGVWTSTGSADQWSAEVNLPSASYIAESPISIAQTQVPTPPNVTPDPLPPNPGVRP